jgi:hypothetical protein
MRFIGLEHMDRLSVAEEAALPWRNHPSKALAKANQVIR